MPGRITSIFSSVLSALLIATPHTISQAQDIPEDAEIFLEPVILQTDDYEKSESEERPATIETASEIPVNCAQTWTVSLPMFDTDSSNLKESIKPILHRFSTQAQRCQNYNYIIETHADKRSTESYNRALTEARAASIKEHLVSIGLEYNRLETIAFGESQLLNHGDAAADHAENRRVVIRP